jgi:NAD(P)-dependent dehydrogenase (short-subunit alcohol dehydrogenase family)
MGANFSLEGKVAIVTGASRGIGEAIARAFLEQGASVALVSRKMESEFASSLGGRAHAIAAHTGQEQSCARIVSESVARFGKVDILVNNAATNPHFGPLVTASDSAWDKTFEVNLKGYFWMVRSVTEHLVGRASAGSLISVASVAGLLASPGQGVYAMTKAAVLSMTKTLAVELAASGIRVNAIAPGFVETKFASAVLGDPGLRDAVMHRTPQARAAHPDEIAGAAVYLASDASSFMTGHTLVVDGGMTIC